MADTPTRTAPAEQRAEEQPGHVPDVELVRDAQGGDAGAFAELVGRHQRQLYRLALRMTGSEADAQEVLQEAFLNAYQKLPNFRGGLSGAGSPQRLVAARRREDDGPRAGQGDRPGGRRPA